MIIDTKIHTHACHHHNVSYVMHSRSTNFRLAMKQLAVLYEMPALLSRGKLISFPRLIMP